MCLLDKINLASFKSLKYISLLNNTFSFDTHMAKIVSSFNTTLTPTNRYGFCRIPDGNGPLGSIAIIGTPFSVY